MIGRQEQELQSCRELVQPTGCSRALGLLMVLMEKPCAQLCKWEWSRRPEGNGVQNYVRLAFGLETHSGPEHARGERLPWRMLQIVWSTDSKVLCGTGGSQLTVEGFFMVEG